jgi:AcrR family transcriptional regulator
MRADAETRLLDAAERLLAEVGYASITTRSVAAAAGLNHGLVHYYFGSMDELFVQVLERFTARLIDRQRALYATDEPFLKKWRTAMRYLEADFASGYQKVWLELQAMSWNHKGLRDRVARVLTDAFTDAADEYRVDAKRVPVDALVSLVATFNQGIILERNCGITEGHGSLLLMVERMLKVLDREKRS